MKFLLIVIAIHFIAELIGRKTDNNKNDKDDSGTSSIHPSEFNIRWRIRMSQQNMSQLYSKLNMCRGGKLSPRDAAGKLLKNVGNTQWLTTMKKIIKRLASRQEDICPIKSTRENVSRKHFSADAIAICMLLTKRTYISITLVLKVRFLQWFTPLNSTVEYSNMGSNPIPIQWKRYWIAKD
jgi:hypothetical protein